MVRLMLFLLFDDLLGALPSEMDGNSFFLEDAPAYALMDEPKLVRFAPAVGRGTAPSNGADADIRFGRFFLTFLLEEEDVLGETAAANVVAACCFFFDGDGNLFFEGDTERRGLVVVVLMGGGYGGGGGTEDACEELSSGRQVLHHRGGL